MLERTSPLPWIVAIGAFVWGFSAGVAAISASQYRGFDLGLGLTIAVIPIAIGAFVNLDRKLRRAEVSQRYLLQEENALQAHCIVSMTDANLRICHVNEKLVEVTGYSEHDLIGLSPMELYFESDLELYHRIIDALKAGQNWSGEVRMKCRDSSAIWTYATIVPVHDHKGTLVSTIAVRTDITAIKLAASKRELFAALNKLSDDVYVFEPETYRFIYMNERALSRLGWDAITYTTKTLADAEPQFEKVRFDKLVAPLLAGEIDRIDLQANVGEKPHDITIQLIRQVVGPPRFVAFFRDISDRVEVERIKEEFIATVSHELRSPLTSIKGAIGLIMGTDDTLSDKTRSMLNIAHRNSDRLVAIVNDILDIEKIAAGKMAFDMNIADLGELVDEAVAANSIGAERFDVRIETRGFEEPALAEFDQARMMQVMTNVLSNAMKFSQPGGRVVVSLATTIDSHVVTVRDFGVGIPADSLPTIFDRFSQAPNSSQRSGSGTGLGLSIVKAIVEQHQGRVSIESEVDRGTSIQLQLPKKAPISNAEHQKIMSRKFAAQNS